MGQETQNLPKREDENDGRIKNFVGSDESVIKKESEKIVNQI